MATQPRQDFLLQPITQFDGSVVWDFPLEDTYINGVIQPTPYGDSDQQHILDIIINNIGALKQFPLLGFGLFQYLNGEEPIDEVIVALTKQMNSDLYKVPIGTVQPVTGGGFQINYNNILPAY